MNTLNHSSKILFLAFSNAVFEKCFSVFKHFTPQDYVFICFYSKFVVCLNSNVCLWFLFFCLSSTSYNANKIHLQRPASQPASQPDSQLARTHLPPDFIGAAASWNWSTMFDIFSKTQALSVSLCFVPKHNA